MSALGERTHYEVLEVNRDASREELERAYRLAYATYAEGSLATYSLYGDDELAAIRARLDEAYRVLTSDEQRERYDEGLSQRDREPVRIDLGLAESAAPSAEVPPEITDFVSLEDGEALPWNGARLRRARLERGIELEQVSRVTKVASAYLRCIEEDRYGDLPAPVYIRGFVSAYARCIGLDADRVSREYVALLAPGVDEGPVRTRRRR